MKGRWLLSPPFLQGLGCKAIQPALLRLGVLRLMGNPGGGRPFGLANFTGAARQELIFLSTNPSTAQTEGEGCVLDESMAEVARSTGNFGGWPLYVLAGSTPFRAPAPRYTKDVAALNDYWFHEVKLCLAALSTHGHLVIEENAERPAAIVQAVSGVVTQSPPGAMNPKSFPFIRLACRPIRSGLPRSAPSLCRTTNNFNALMAIGRTGIPRFSYTLVKRKHVRGSGLVFARALFPSARGSQTRCTSL